MYPYTRRHDVVAAGAPGSAEWHDVSADPHAYWRLLRDAWADALVTGDDLMVVEHDVVCRSDVIPSFEECPEPWCVFGYTPICHQECQEAWANMLGCTRWRNELIQARPEALSHIPPELRDWHNLCDHIAGNKINGTDSPQHPKGLRAKFAHHWHTPPVEHITWLRYGKEPDVE